VLFRSLALVVCALVVALAYPMRQYVAQRSQIADQRKQAEEAQKRVDELREQKARWQDPEYVKSQAREHLHYVMPGETDYTVVDPSASASSSARRSSDQSAARNPWYDNLWSGVDYADTAAGR
jgi:cell division protein FtsB